MVADSSGDRGTCQLQQGPENPLCLSWAQQVCWGEPFLLEDETWVWFFPKRVLSSVNRICLCLVMGAERSRAFSPVSLCF